MIKQKQMEPFKLIEVDYRKPYREQTDCKRHVIGAYANLARHHLTLAVNAIMRSIGMEQFDENNIGDAFNKTHREKISRLDNIQKVALEERLYRHFPMLKRMQLEDEKKKSVQLKTLLEKLYDFTDCMAVLRNYYTHYRPYNTYEEMEKQAKRKREVGKCLQYLFENSSKVFKSNEKLDIAANEVLSRIRVKQGKKYEFNPNHPAYMMDKANGLSDTGVVYFLCLFLEKQQAFGLMDETGYTKYCCDFYQDDEQVLILKELMCMNRIRMTQSKLDSEISETALALDMLNELRKCPRPLYEVLGKEARDEFKDEMTADWESENNVEAISVEETADATATDNDGKGRPRSTMVRWEDRFPQMALSYIDQRGWFDDIRFQLLLGKYRFDFYSHEKKYNIDGEESRLRVLQKELHGFGRLPEVKKEVKAKWAHLLRDGLEASDATTEPYITEQTPQYAIDENSHSIGLRWEGWDNGSNRKNHYNDLDKLKMFVPYIPKGTPRDVTEQKHPCPAEPFLPPQCQMSLYELPGLLFYEYLRRKQPDGTQPTAEAIIKACYSNLKRFFEDVRDGKLVPVADKTTLENKLKEDYNLRISDIPKRLCDFLLNNAPDENEQLKKSAQVRLKERREKLVRLQKRYEDKKERIGTDDNKFGKNRATIKPGALAQWLAHDIMDWMPTAWKASHQLTGQNFMAMQSALALFGQPDFGADGKVTVDYTRLKNLFEKAAIISKVGGHPFLAEVMGQSKYGPKSVEEFYEKYLAEGIAHIKKIEAEIPEDTAIKEETLQKIPFLRRDRSRWKESTKDLASNYLDKPLQLPDGLFASEVFGMLSPELQGIAMEKQLETNTAYLINLYFENVEQDQSQSYYYTDDKKYRHIYRAFKKLYGTRLNPSPAFTIEQIREKRKEAYAKAEAEGVDKKLLHKVYDNERTIRRFKTQDILLFLMARDILLDKDARKAFKLKDIQDGDVLDREIDFSWKLVLKDGEKERVKTIEQKGMRIRNYGQFYKFATDHHRLQSLLLRLSKQHYLRAEIENELAHYDRNRSEVFRFVYFIESEALELAKQWGMELTDERNHFFKLLELWAKGEDGVLDADEMELLRTIRNAFGHNTYEVDFDRVFDCEEDVGKRRIPLVSDGITDKIGEEVG